MYLETKMKIGNGSILVNGLSTIFSVSIQFGEIGPVHYFPYSSIFISLSPFSLVATFYGPSSSTLFAVFSRITGITPEFFTSLPFFFLLLRPAIRRQVGQIELFVAPQGLGGS